MAELPQKSAKTSSEDKKEWQKKNALTEEVSQKLSNY